MGTFNSKKVEFSPLEGLTHNNESPASSARELPRERGYLDLKSVFEGSF